MRYPIKEGAGVPYGYPAGTKVDKFGYVIGKTPVEEPKPKAEEPKK